MNTMNGNGPVNTVLSGAYGSSVASQSSAQSSAGQRIQRGTKSGRSGRG